MSDDSINRQAAIDAIDCDIVITGRKNAELVAETIAMFADRIKSLPSAEQKTGKWIDISAFRNMAGDYSVQGCCSVCNYTLLK